MRSAIKLGGGLFKHSGSLCVYKANIGGVTNRLCIFHVHTCIYNTHAMTQG